MKIYISQPKLSNDIEELKHVMQNIDCDCVFFPEGYIALEKLVGEVVNLAKSYKKAVITSYRTEENSRDRAILINENGDIIFDREKSSIEGPLLLPMTGKIHEIKTGYVLCREIFLDYRGLKTADIIFNPIGVGMFSEEQYVEWTSRAKEIAIASNSIIIGSSHADGSYRNCGFSIPLAFVYDSEGKTIYESKNDTRSVLVDLNNRKIEVIEL